MVKRKAWSSRSLLLYTRNRGALRHAGPAHEVRMQIGGEIAKALTDALVAAKQPVVTHDRRNGHEQTERSHDERLTDGACHLVDARLATQGDRNQRVQNAPHRAEQADERGGRADRREKRETIAHLAVHGVDGALQGHRDPLVQIDTVRETALMVSRGTQTIFSDGTEIVVLREAVNRFLEGA